MKLETKRKATFKQFYAQGNEKRVCARENLIFLRTTLNSYETNLASRQSRRQ